MYSAYKLNKQGDNIQPWSIPFLIWCQSVVLCPVLIAASWPAYRFLKRQERWSDIPISLRIFQFVVIHTIKGFDIVNKAEVDVFLELSHLFCDPVFVGNLISGSSASSKSSLNIWKFLVHVLLKPGLENFEHYFSSVWDECNCGVVRAFFGIAFLWDWNETDFFQSYGHCWVFQICWHIECGTFIASSFRIWNSSTGIPSLPLALFIVMLPKAQLTSHSRLSSSRWVITSLWLSGSWRSFLFSFSVPGIASSDSQTHPVFSLLLPLFIALSTCTAIICLHVCFFNWLWAS